MANFDGTDAFFDSREVIERIADLEALATNGDGKIDAALLDDEDAEEYAALDELRNDADGVIADFEYGETFISEAHFADYAEELAYDIGAIDREASWPLNRINWDAAADDLKTDYTEFEFRGTTYYAR